MEREFDLLSGPKRIGTERPLREMEMTARTKNGVRGFMFLSEKPMLYALNVSESADLGGIWKTRMRNLSWRKWSPAECRCDRRYAAR